MRHVLARRKDAAFLLGRVLTGIGAYALLAVGGAALLVLGGALALLVTSVLPVVGLVLSAVAAFVLLARRSSPTVRRWVARGPLRRTAVAVLRASGRALAAAAVWWLLACRATARRERRRVAAHRGADVPIAYRPLPDDRAGTLRVLGADAATWRDLAYLVVAPAYAFLACAALLLLCAWGIVLLVEAGTAGPPGSPQTWAAVAAGVGLLVASPLPLHLLARGASGIGAGLLSTGEASRMRAERDEQRLRRQLAVDAAERERRRIERDLHDGAQQRLVGLGMTLGLARQALPEDPEAGSALVAEAHAEAKLALAELRDLARGIHPAILADRGLDAALSALVRRSPIPVSVIVVLPRRPPTAIESAAYFVVSEALANVARHARAGSATVRITQDPDADVLVVEVADDGIGGADPAAGTGLAGLADRVEALDGRFCVDSPPQGPTTVRAELPCGS